MLGRCYNCGALATSEEHAPPASFFPEGYASGLIIVPSCADHNSGLSKDVEYVRNVICTHLGVNLVASRVAATARQSYQHSPALFKQTYSTVQTVRLAGGETGAFTVDMARLKSVIKAIAYAMYYHDFGRRNEGDFDVFAASLHSRSSLYRGVPDGYEGLRAALEASHFKGMPVPQPKVFKYGYSRPGEGQIHYKFEFYESFCVYALTLPHRLSPVIYLPVTRDWSVLRLANG